MASLESINRKLKAAVLELIEVECDNYAQHLIKMMKIDKVVSTLMSFMLNNVYDNFDSITIEEFDEIYTSLKTIKDGILLRIKNYFKECGSSTKKYEIRKLYNLIVSKLEVLVNEANTFKKLASIPTGKTQISKGKVRTLNYLKSKGKTKLVRVLNSDSVTNSLNNIPEEYVKPDLGLLQNNYGQQVMNKLRSRKARRKSQRKYDALRNPMSTTNKPANEKTAPSRSATKSATEKSSAPRSATRSAVETIRTAQKTFMVTTRAASNNGVSGKNKSKRSRKKKLGSKK